MHPRTFALVALFIAAGCGSPAPTHNDDEAPNAPPIQAEMARAPVTPAPADAQDPRSPSRVMAYVEGEVLTYREILQQVGPELAQLDSNAEKQKLEEKVLIQLLRDRLLYRAAVDAGVRATRDDVEEKRTEKVKKLAKSGGTLEAFLREHDMTRREYDEFIRQQIVIDKYQRAAIGHSIDGSVHVRPVTDTYVAPEDVRKYYDRHAAKFSEPEGARYRKLIVKSDLEAPDRAAAVAAARAIADDAVARLKGGEDWVPVYRELSKTPPDPREPDGLCSIERDKAADWIEHFAFEQPKGAVLQEQKGTTFYVLQAEGAHEARVVPYEEASKAVHDQLQQLRVGMAFLEVELAVLDESSVQPEAVRAKLRNTLRGARLQMLEEIEK